MSQQELTSLLKKYMAEACTPAEKQALAALIADHEQQELLKASVEALWIDYQPNEQLPAADSQQYFQGILQQIQPITPHLQAVDDALTAVAGSNSTKAATAAPVHRIHFLRRGWVRIAAAVIAAATIATVTYLNLPKTTPTGPVSKSLPGTGTPVNLVRNIILPDNSVVVLQANSTLQYPQTFTGTAREVTLTGEAYFDVAHDSLHPFIIHSGAIKTTVLGTAFNIKAWPADKEIVVTVTRGKVRVEDASKILGIITPNQQISFNRGQATAKQLVVDAGSFTAWKDSAYSLDNITLDDALTDLQMRYGVLIELAKPEAAASCRFTASFHQHESLDYVLNIISKLNGATWRKEGERIVIDNVHCN